MPYTYLSLAAVWLIGLALVGAAESGQVTGGGLVALVLLALTMPSILLRMTPALAPAEAAHNRGAR